jgi:hypothetical protein
VDIVCIAVKIRVGTNESWDGSGGGLVGMKERDY